MVDGMAGAATDADKRTGNGHLQATLAGRDESVNPDAMRFKAL
jgi:hypothetical protein